MQLSAVLAQPPAQQVGASPLLPILTTLRGERPPATQAVPPESEVARSDPGRGAALLSDIAQSQDRFLANQQLLGEVTSVLGARFSHIAKTAWAMLRGTGRQPDQQVAAS